MGEFCRFLCQNTVLLILFTCRTAVIILCAFSLFNHAQYSLNKLQHYLHEFMYIVSLSRCTRLSDSTTDVVVRCAVKVLRVFHQSWLCAQCVIEYGTGKRYLCLAVGEYGVEFALYVRWKLTCCAAFSTLYFGDHRRNVCGGQYLLCVVYYAARQRIIV